MTLTAAVLLGLGAMLALFWLVSKYVTPSYQTRSYVSVAVLGALYMLGVFKLFQNS